jgi:hypothetical protein
MRSVGQNIRHQTVERASLLWPRIDRRALSRCSGDPECIARQVAQRSSLPEHSIIKMIAGEPEA